MLSRTALVLPSGEKEAIANILKMSVFMCTAEKVMYRYIQNI